MIDLAAPRMLATLPLPESLDLADLCVVEHGGRFHMWLALEDGSDLLRLSSDSPTEWNWNEARPVFGDARPAQPAAVGHPFVLHHQRLWYLWYTVAVDDRVRMCAATSSHGDKWLGHTTALDPAECDGVALADPAVVRDHARRLWLMTHSVREGDLWRVALSESHDLQQWTPTGVLMETWMPPIRHCRGARLCPADGAWRLFFVAEHDDRRRVYASSSEDLVWWRTPSPLLGDRPLPSGAEQVCIHPLSRGNGLLLYVVLRGRGANALVILRIPNVPSVGG